VRVVYSRVTANTATLGYGGGIVTRAGLTVNHSHVSNNRASFLGGVTSIGLTTRHSTFSNNDGGTIFSVNGDLIIANSTISDNTDKVGSGYPVVHWYAGPGLGSASIIDSTISGNASSEVETVGLVGAGPKSIVNSTIAFNQGFALCDDPSNAATVLLGGGTTLLDSTIISNNSCSGNPQYSVGGTGFPGPSVLVGANNLITTPAGLELPADTITANPRLAPLADNGGPTKTHALPADSPAINNGNNEAGLGYDQRGQGFPRSAGGSTDIGAFERQQL